MSNLLEQKKYTFNNETIASLEDLADVLKKIHKRLLRDGYTIINGKIKHNKCKKIVKKK